MQKLYGLAFPDDLYAFHEFMRSYPAACKTLGIARTGPLAVLDGDDSRAEERFRNDPPELFGTVLGAVDGLHWGYRFDSPGKMKPVVVSYHAHDALEIGVDGASTFEAAYSGGSGRSFRRDLGGDSGGPGRLIGAKRRSGSGSERSDESGGQAVG